MPPDGPPTLSPRAAELILGLSLAVAVLSLAVAVSILWLLGHPPAPSIKPDTTWYARHLTQAGIASWYGPRFHGRRTASGERFDQNKMTAAHRTLRFGTFVVVTTIGAEDKRLREERQRVEALRQQAVREAAAERERWAKEQAAERAEQQAEYARIKRELAEERIRINHEREDRGLAPHPPPGTWPEPSEPSAPSEPAPDTPQAEPGRTVMRVRFEKQGGHYHCRVFTAKRIGQTFAKNGELVFDEAEWPDIPLLMRGAEFVEEVAEWPG